MCDRVAACVCAHGVGQHLFWWELIEMIRRFVLVGLLVLARGSIAQIVAGTLLAAFFLLLQVQALTAFLTPTATLTLTLHPPRGLLLAPPGAGPDPFPNPDRYPHPYPSPSSRPSSCASRCRRARTANSLTTSWHRAPRSAWSSPSSVLTPSRTPRSPRCPTSNRSSQPSSGQCTSSTPSR